MYLVELAPETYKAISDQLLEYPVLVPVWRDVTVRFEPDGGTPKTMVLSCDETQVEALISMATLYCPSALPLIQGATNKLKPKPESLQDVKETLKSGFGSE
jgi:hypothetical protein